MPNKSRSVAIVLALFLGGIGAQKFYLNKPLAGVLSVLFCWTFIPSIIAVYDIVVFLSMGDEKFQAKYSPSTQ